MDDLLGGLRSSGEMESPEVALEGASVLYVASSVHVFLNFFMERLLRLKGHGFRVTCASPEDGPLGPLGRAGIEHVRIPMGRHVDPGRAAVTCLLLASEMIQRGVTVVHSHTTTVHLVSALAAKAAGVPLSVATIHGHYHTGLEHLMGAGEARVASWVSRAYYEQLAGLVDAYLVINRTEHEALGGLVSEEKLKLIEGGVGVDLDRFLAGSLPSRGELRRRFGLGQGLVVGFVGRLIEHKAGELLKIIDRLQALLPKVEVMITTMLEADVGLAEGIAARRAAGRRLVLLRDRAPEEMPGVYKALDVLILPSRREGASTVLMEAAAMGLPVVAYDIAGTRDVVEAGKTGELVPVGRTEMFVEAVLHLLRSASRRQSYGRASRARAESRFSRAWSGEQVLSLYDRLLRQKLSSVEGRR